MGACARYHSWCGRRGTLRGRRLAYWDAKGTGEEGGPWVSRGVVQSSSHVKLFVTPGTVAPQASLSITISQSLPKFMSIASVMPSSHLILWHPLLLLPSIVPSSRDFSNESTIRIRWPRYWSLGFSKTNSNVIYVLTAFLTKEVNNHLFCICLETQFLILPCTLINKYNIG